MFIKFILYIATLSILYAAPDSFSSLGNELENFNNDCNIYKKIPSIPATIQKQCKQFNQDIKKAFKVGYQLDAIIAKGKENEKLLNKYLNMLRKGDKKRENIISLLQKSKKLARKNSNHKVYQQLIQIPSLHLYTSDYQFMELHSSIYSSNPRYKQYEQAKKEKELEQQRQADARHNNTIKMNFSSKSQQMKHSGDEYDNIVCDKKIAKAYPQLFKRHPNANWMDFKYSFPRNRWKRTGLTPLEALRWTDLGFKVSDLNSLKAIGVKTPADAKKWICAGMFEGSIAPGIINPFFNHVEIAYKNNITPEEAYRWYKLKVFPYEIVKRKKLGVVSANDAKKWIDIGIVHSKQLKGWVEAKITDPKNAKKWIDVVNTTQNTNYSNSNILHTIKYKWFQEAKVTNPTEAMAWKKLHINYYTIGKWKKEGYTPKDAAPWIQKKIENGYKWKKAGFKVSVAQKWIKAGITDGYYYNPIKHTINNVLKYKNCIKGVDEGVSYFLEKNAGNPKKIIGLLNLSKKRKSNCKETLDNSI